MSVRRRILDGGTPPNLGLQVGSAILLRMTRANGELIWEAEALRVVGEVKRAAGAAEADADLRTAIDIARRQGAKVFELRATISLARLWAREGERHRARVLLAPVYGWFTEGFDTPDLREARALLDELASAPPGLRTRARQRSALR